MPLNLSDCDDTAVIVQALRDNPYEIDIKAGGTAMRFMTALLSVRQSEEHVITGTERMKHRPIGPLVDALRRLGADISYVGEEGFPPLRIKGRQLEGGLLEVPGNISSQYISALLMIGPMLHDGLTLRLTGDIISRPYIDLTLWMMHEFGADAEWADFETIRVNAQPYTERPYFIESDWSAASRKRLERCQLLVRNGGAVEEPRRRGALGGPDGRLEAGRLVCTLHIQSAGCQDHLRHDRGREAYHRDAAPFWTLRA